LSHASTRFFLVGGRWLRGSGEAGAAQFGLVNLPFTYTLSGLQRDPSQLAALNKTWLTATRSSGLRSAICQCVKVAAARAAPPFRAHRTKVKADDFIITDELRDRIAHKADYQREKLGPDLAASGGPPRRCLNASHAISAPDRACSKAPVDRSRRRGRASAIVRQGLPRVHGT
jgi:hypothetical protein